MTPDAAWREHKRAIRIAQKARTRAIERARRHLKALDACAVTLGVTRLRMLELAATPENYVNPAAVRAAKVADATARRVQR